MTWIERIERFCEKYNIPIEHLADILYEPKVIPMIRGKAFEFTVLLALRQVLPTSEFVVDKVPMNAQSGIHDEDVIVKHLDTGKRIRIECKLAAKGHFRQVDVNRHKVDVKCMRSRTLGESKVKQLAPLWGVDETQLQIHNDQYLPADFDVLVTTIGNAFYETNAVTGHFEWSASDQARVFLEHLKGDHENMENFAFNSLFMARSRDLAIIERNKIACTRRRYTSPSNCGFILNYPTIQFENYKVTPPWYPLTDFVSQFRQIALE